MKNNYWMLVFIVIVLIACSTMCIYTYSTKVTIVYVDLTILFNKFDYKLELERKFDATKQTRKSMLDTMEVELQGISRKIEAGEADKKLMDIFDAKRRQIVERSEYFEQDNSMQSKDYNDKIWVQLNQYLKEYRELKHYDFILGATGNGAIMASNPDKDITNDAVAFINKRYNGN